MDYAILINKINKIDENYYRNVVMPSIVPVESFKNNDLIYKSFEITERKTYLERKTAQQFTKLRNYALKNGIYLGITNGFLTFEQQRIKYEYFLNKRGKEFAERSACLPGYSEHHTGLALDCDIFMHSRWGGIAVTRDRNINSQTAWLHGALYKFGFILRYPVDKEYITKMKFEPWHIRYIGEEIAGYLYMNNLTLEEFYEKLYS